MACSDNSTTDDYSILNYQTQYSVGDTVWLEMSIPKTLVCKDVDREPVSCDIQDEGVLFKFIDFAIYEQDNPHFMVYNNQELSEYFVYDENSPYSIEKEFVFNESMGKYIHKIGIIVPKIGKFTLKSGGSSEALYIDVRFSNVYCNDFTYFESTFKETGSGWFEFEVVE